jgi:hypothetical protein
MRFLSVLALVAASLVLPATVLSATADAKAPCRDRIYNDWYQNGKIASTYPLACYRDAITHVPNDAKIYSSLQSDIRRALQAAIERSRGKTDVPGQVGRGLPSSDSGGVKNANVSMSPRATTTTTTSRATTTSVEHVPPASARRGDVSGPDVSAAPVASTSSSGGGLPLPIIVLGAIALLLAGVGAAGTVARRVRRR